MNLRYAKRRFTVVHNVSAPCLSHVINYQRLLLYFYFAGVGTIYMLVLTNLGFGRAVEGILSRVNVEDQFFVTGTF